MDASDKDVQAAFADVSDPALLQKLSHLCRTYGLSAEELQTKWELLCVTDPLGNMKMSVDTLPQLEALPQGSKFAHWFEQIQPPLHACTDQHEGCKGWAQMGECTKNPLFMHSGCPASCGSCDKLIDDINPEDATRGDWRHANGERQKERNAAAAYVATAEVEELDELSTLIGERQDALNKAAAEEKEEEEEDLHTEL